MSSLMVLVKLLLMKAFALSSSLARKYSATVWKRPPSGTVVKSPESKYIIIMRAFTRGKYPSNRFILIPLRESSFPLAKRIFSSIWQLLRILMSNSVKSLVKMIVLTAGIPKVANTSISGTTTSQILKHPSNAQLSTLMPAGIAIWYRLTQLKNA